MSLILGNMVLSLPGMKSCEHNTALVENLSYEFRILGFEELVYLEQNFEKLLILLSFSVINYTGPCQYLEWFYPIFPNILYLTTISLIKANIFVLVITYSYIFILFIIVSLSQTQQYSGLNSCLYIQ